MTADHEHPDGGTSANRSYCSSSSSRADESPLNRVFLWLKRYIITVSDEDLHILTLWVAHTWLMDALPSTPRLQLDSIAPGSGKSTTLEHLGRLTRDSSHMASITSAAMLSRMIDARPRTLLLDEVDRALDPNAENTAPLLAILNSGYRKGATRPVLVPAKGGGWDVEEMNTYAPVALAGNSPRLPDDTRSRMTRIVLMPDVEGRAEETNWEDMSDEIQVLSDDLQAWAESVLEEVRGMRPELPTGCTGRNRERWAPLLRVALAAGGEWPGRVDGLILRDMEEQQMIRDEGLQRIPPAVQLMVDVKTVFDRNGDHFIETRELVNYLINENKGMWSQSSDYGKDLTAQRLGRMLSSSWRIYSIQRPDGKRARGYLRSHLEAGFRQVAGMMPNNSNDSNSTNGYLEGVSDSSDAPTYLPIPTREMEHAS